MRPNVDLILKRLVKRYPEAKIALRSSNPLELLIATILSAQCTDERVNLVTQRLFRKYRSLQDYAAADLKEFEQDIRSTGFYHNKAKNILAAANMIRERFGGKVPARMEDILLLPGVARKTANVVLGNAYDIVEGIVVDTHVRRVSQRLDLTRNENPEKIEHDLMKLMPRSRWLHFSYLIQALGRDVCKAQRPNHAHCVLNDVCPSSNI
ncbi:MAG: endonuclease III [Elusimicrobia bacterium RIFOXYB2_FULL_49_7]|nr:MAG: endonuclease III [Elusimicrobia bacterium RIFOXYB2_FULL_49_7]